MKENSGQEVQDFEVLPAIPTEDESDVVNLGSVIENPFNNIVFNGIENDFEVRGDNFQEHIPSKKGFKNIRHGKLD